MSVLAARIKSGIEKMGISILEFERRANLNRNAVHNIISGKSKKPSTKTIYAIAEAFGCEPHELIDGLADKHFVERVKRTYLDLEVVHKCTQALTQELLDKDIDLTMDEYIALFEDIYSYQDASENKMALDKTFIEWIIKKHLEIS